MLQNASLHGVDMLLLCETLKEKNPTPQSFGGCHTHIKICCAHGGSEGAGKNCSVWLYTCQSHLPEKP